MLIGHYSSAYVGRALDRRAPLWAMFVAAMLVDLVHWVLLLVGVEHTRLDPSLPTNPLVVEYVPYSHSLAATLVWSALAFAVGARLWGRRSGAVLAAVTCAHWFEDLVVHRPDLTLFGTGPRLGLALWNYPALAHTLELALLAGAVALCAWRVRPARPYRFALVALVLVGVQTVAILGPPPDDVPVLAVSLLAMFAVTAALAAWAESPAARPRAS